MLLTNKTLKLNFAVLQSVNSPEVALQIFPASVILFIVEQLFEFNH